LPASPRWPGGPRNSGKYAIVGDLAFSPIQFQDSPTTALSDSRREFFSGVSNWRVLIRRVRERST
jgi:hypothetical protein